MDNNDTDSLPQADPTPDVKLTVFGYSGDSTPDYNSIVRHVGDRENKLRATDDHQSVALTRPERERIFGVDGKSTGQAFTYRNKTYWDEDTAPEGDYRIDVFNPDHPPDKLTLRSGHGHDYPRQQGRSSLYQDWTPPKEEPTPTPDSYKDSERPKREPIGDEDDSILSPQNMVKRIRNQYPQYVQVGDQKLWNSFKAKYPTGLQQLRATFPEYRKVSDDKFLKAIKEKFFPDDSEDEFIDRVNPPSGVGGLYHSVAEQVPRIVSGFYQGTAELGKFPERAVQAIDSAVQALGLDKKPPGKNEVTPLTRQLLSGIADPNAAQRMAEWADRQVRRGEKWTKQAKIPQPRDIAGKTAALAFQSLGAAPAIVPAFLPVSGEYAAGALAIGMIYDGIQGWGKAREAGMDNSMMFGSEGASYRALQEWLLRTPRGRLLSAVLWAGSGMADKEAQDFMADPKAALDRAFKEPVNTLSDLIATGAVNGMFGSIASIGLDAIPKAAKDTFSQAVEARSNGDYKEAARLMDKTMLLLPDMQRKAATNNLLAWRNEAIEARNGDAPLEMPGQRGFLTVSKTESSMGDALAQPAKGATDVRPEPTPAQAVSDDLETIAPEQPKVIPPSPKGPDAVTDQYYYSGIDVGKAIEELGKTLLIENKTPQRQASAAIIGEEIGRMQRENQRMAQNWYLQQKLEDEFKWAYKADQRRAFWAGVPRGTLMKWFEQHEAGHATGNRIADRLFELHDGFMKALAKRDQGRGFMYNLRDSYIYHLLKNTEDFPKLEAAIKQRGWGDPKFMHPREVPTVEMLHALGIKLRTYNLEDLDQIRLEGSNLAEMRAATLEQMHAAKLAFSKGDITKLEKENPGLAQQYMSQTSGMFWRSPRAVGDQDVHQLYYLHPGAEFMLRRATDPVTWKPEYLGKVVKGIQAIKQRTVGLNLGLSLYHQVHMLDIASSDSVALAYSKSLAGKGTLQDWARAISDVTSLGISTQIRAIRYNQKLLNWYLSNAAKDVTPRPISFLNDLSPHEREAFSWQKEAGFVPLISHERQIQLSRWLMAKSHVTPKKPGLDPLDIGYSIVTSRPYTQWLFSRVIPSLKMYSFDQYADALFQAKPWLKRPEYAMDRKVALRGIARQVDDRYGEQNLRQSFEDPHLKQVGQAVLLSYSWKKSFVGVYGGAVHDLTDVKLREGPSRAGTNRMAYATTLTAMNALKNIMVATFIGVGVKSLKDAFFPNIGYEKDGKTLKRIKPPYWLTTEIAGWRHHAEAEGPFMGTMQMGANSLMPELSTLYDVLITNKDYYGTQISDPADNFLDQMKDKLVFSLKQNTPFTVQAWLRPGSEPQDVLLQLLGVPHAPAWAERSEIENRIIRDYVARHIPPEKTHAIQAQMDARRDYRAAVQSKDAAAQSSAAQKMRSLGMSDRSIKNTEKTAGESEAVRLFSHMSPDEQLTYLRSMDHEDLQNFWPKASKKLHQKFHNHLSELEANK